jgi:hypothetical protein
MKRQANFKLPAAFFTKVLKDYRDWKYAWVREVLQNAIDALSTTITITGTEINPDLFSFTIKDNGKGMSLSVLEECFMALGGSAKEEGDTGGFGVASMMIAQSHVDYTIRSHHYICHGSKGEYTVEDGQAFMKGCEITVRMTKSSFNAYNNPIVEMRNNLAKWANYSSVKGVCITYNDQDYSPTNRTFDHCIDTEIGTMRFSDATDNYNTSTLFVRVNKQAMFSVESYHDDGIPFDGVLDLTGSSVEVLTSNRDGLTGEKNRIVSNLLQELSKERTKYTLGNMSEFVLNENFIDDLSALEYQPEPTPVDSDENDSSSAPNENDNSSNKQATLKESHDEKHEDGSQKVTSKGIFQKEKQTFEKQKSQIIDRLKRIKNESYPENFNIKHDLSSNSLAGMTDLIKALNQKRYQKIAWTWKAVVESTLDALCYTHSYYYRKKGETYFFNSKPIKLGFIFKSEAEGLCSVGRDECIIYINPKIAYEFDLECIQDVAFHELAHIEYNGHSESFTVQESSIRRLWRKHGKLVDIKVSMRQSHREMA